MPTFPRAAGALSRLATPPRFPGGLQSWGQSGRGQFRSVQNAGRVWTEIYPVLNTTLPSVRALLEAINRGMREGILWDVQHPYWHVRNGVGGGTPLVAGGGQSGSSIAIDGCTPSITNWLRAGDILTIAGCPVIFDQQTDVNSDSSGRVTLLVSPPIFVGQVPADNAVVNIVPSTIFFKAVITDVSDFPNMDTTKYIDAGLTITWREQPI
jgi:hypothetical protein